MRSVGGRNLVLGNAGTSVDEAASRLIGYGGGRGDCSRPRPAIGRRFGVSLRTLRTRKGVVLVSRTQSVKRHFDFHAATFAQSDFAGPDPGRDARAGGGSAGRRWLGNVRERSVLLLFGNG